MKSNKAYLMPCHLISTWNSIDSEDFDTRWDLWESQWHFALEERSINPDMMYMLYWKPLTVIVPSASHLQLITMRPEVHLILTNLACRRTSWRNRRIYWRRRNRRIHWRRRGWRWRWRWRRRRRWTQRSIRNLEDTMCWNSSLSTIQPPFPRMYRKSHCWTTGRRIRAQTL